MNKIEKQVVSGTKWTTLATVLVTFINIVKVFVLTRYLSKDEFGVFAIIMFVLGFTELFTDMGVSVAILFKQNISHEQYSTLFWFNLVLAILSYIILLVLTPFLADFYEVNELNWLLPIAGVNLIFLILGKQHKTIFQKELQFKVIGLTEIIAALMSFVFLITLLNFFIGIEVMIFSTLLQSFILSLIFLSVGFKAYPIKLKFQLNQVRDLLKIGGYQLGSQALNYFGRDFDIMILGKIVGMEGLGGYSLAKQLIKKPQFILSSVIMRISNALFPKFQNKKDELDKSFLYLINISILVFSLVFFFCFVMSEEIMILFYGMKYISDSLYLKWFSILILIRSILSLNYSLVVAKGKTNYDFYWNLGNALVTVVMVYVIAKNLSIIWVIKSLCVLSFFLLIFAWHFFIKKLTEISFLTYFKIIFKNIISGVLASIILFFFLQKIVVDHLIVSLFLNFVVFVISYVIFQFLLNKNMMRILLKKLISKKK